MSAVLQNMISAPGPIRTESTVFSGYRPELAKIRPSQWVTWELGDVAVIGTRFRLANERLCEALKLQTGERVLNVTAGDGNTALPQSTKLPFRDSAFDVVVSGFGAMFAADHFRMARELLRVCRKGGRIGLACWTPQGFNGAIISTVARYSMPDAKSESPVHWGTREYLDNLFGHSADALGAITRTHTWNYTSTSEWLKNWRSPGGPLHELYESVDPDWRDQLTSDLLAIADHFNESDVGTMLVRSDYVEFLAHKSTWRV